VRTRAARKPKNATPIAPTITKAKDGSHAPSTSRNPITLRGSAIPETTKPPPKSAPETSAAPSSRFERALGAAGLAVSLTA
jgi:hypothetical protein